MYIKVIWQKCSAVLFRHFKFLSNCLVFFTICFFGGCSSFSSRTTVENSEKLNPQIFTFKAGGNAIFYHFELGSPTENSAVVFFVSGSGCASVRDRFSRYFNPIKHQFDAHVFVLQKRGIEENSNGNNCPTDFIHTDYFDQTVADQVAFIDHHLESRVVSPRAVVLMGASEGAVVAAKIASTNTRITHLALIGSGGQTVRKNLQLLSKNVWYMRNVETQLSNIEKEPNREDLSVWGHSYKYWSSLLDVDIGSLLMSLDIPIVLAMGEKDESVPIETAHELQKKFSEKGKSNLYFYSFPDSDHRLYNRRNNVSHAKDFLEGMLKSVQEN
jgi:predicted esterase